MSTVNVERQGGVATMTMNRPDQMNAYDFEMGKELLGAVSALGADPATRGAPGSCWYSSLTS